MTSSELLNGITKQHRRQDALAHYVIAQDQILGNRVKWCATWLHFRQYLQVDESRLMGANFCRKFTLCQGCAVRRAVKFQTAYLPKIEAVLAENQKLIPAMITLTVKDGDDLEERLDHLRYSWKKMGVAKRRAASRSSRNQLIEWNKVVGSLRATEVTFTKKRKWHPHYHMFVLLSDYVDVHKLSAEWHRFTGDSMIVDVRKVKAKDGGSGVKSGLVEVLKYVTKFNNLTPAQCYHVHEAFVGCRTVDPQGLLRGVQVPDIESDELDLSGPYREFIANWLMAENRFHLSQVTEKFDLPATGYRSARVES